ncbi:MAG: M48 family metalloprotease [Spirochaetales bacterium]|nr:M48 family metalloprotease [Spirochaetales bacterium]
MLGKPVMRMDRALTRVIAIDELDEKEYGAAIARRYGESTNAHQKDREYVQQLVEQIPVKRTKDFKYEVFIIDSPSINAFALPGGVILITAGILDFVESEAELMAILAHEVGHVELTHCLTLVRMELLGRKIRAATLGQIADFAMSLVLRHSYNKSQEGEADDFAWTYLRQSPYDPAALGLFFRRMDKAMSQQATRGPLIEYLQSHPHLLHRAERYSAQANQFYRMQPQAERFIGRKSLKARIPLHRLPSADREDFSLPVNRQR